VEEAIVTPDNTGYELRLAVLSIGPAGAHGECRDGSHISFPDNRLRPYLGELIEGGFVIDKRAALEADPVLTARTPLCDGSLPDGMRATFLGWRDQFDVVAPDVYAAWWEAHGARVGRRRGDKIVWADGAEEAIPPYARRFEEGRP
jgi:hypothetical protein